MRRLLSGAGGFTLMVGVATILTALSGAIPGEFGGHADEGAHYVTGLLVHDFLRSGMQESPMSYALRYYAHYPAVAFGHWPPLFYGIEALWMFLFGASRLAMVLLGQICAGFFAWQFGRIVAAKYAGIAAVVAGATLLAVPVIRRQALFVSPELLMVALMLLAVRAYARFTETRALRDALAFGVLSAAAILTKGNALALALLPPFVAVLDRDLRVFRTRALWIGAAVVVVFAGAWQVVTIRDVAYGWEGQPGLDFAARSLEFMGRTLLRSLGLPLLLLSAIGAFHAVRRWDQMPRVWRCTIVLALATVVFHAVIPASLEPRYVIGAVPGVLLLGIEGLMTLAQLVRRGWRAVEPVTLAFTALAVAAIGLAWRPSVPTRLELDQVAEAVAQRAGSARTAVLISSPQAREVAFVAEMAARDRERPHHYVVRANKLLAAMDWNGGNYRALAETPEDVLAALDRIPIRFVVVDARDVRTGAFPYHRMLREAMDLRPDIWRPQPWLRVPDLMVYERSDSLARVEPRVAVPVRGRVASDPL
jgi:4-amino-4-deoxy-L-arabinose transferase-like glycosyltransferase